MPWIEHVDQVAIIDKEFESIRGERKMTQAVCCFDNGEVFFFDHALA